MQLFVTLPSGSVLTLEVEANDTIENVKSKVEEQAGFAPEDQTLTFEGAALEAGRTLADYNISDGSTLNLTLPSTTTTAAPTTTTAPTTTAPTTTASPTISTSASTSAPTSTASPTTAVLPITTAPTTATTAAVLSGSAAQSGSLEQLPATGGSTILLLVGMLTAILGQALVGLSNRSKNATRSDL